MKLPAFNRCVFPLLSFLGEGEGREEIIIVTFIIHLRSHMATKTQEHISLPDRRAVEWPGARGCFIFLSGVGPRPVSGNVVETGAQPAHMPGRL